MLITKLILLHLLGAFSGIPDRFSEEEFRGTIKEKSPGYFSEEKVFKNYYWEGRSWRATLL